MSAALFQVGKGGCGREVQVRARQVVEVVRQGVQGDVRHGLGEFGVGHAGGPRLVQGGVADLAAVFDQVGGQAQDRLGVRVGVVGAAGVEQFLGGHLQQA